MASRLAFFSLETGAIETIMPVEEGMPTRINDGKCDRDGRFVFGTKREVPEAGAIGGFYRLNADLSLERLPLGNCEISNSIAFSPDGSRMYYCDSLSREIRVCDYDSFENQRVFVKLSDATSLPDGSAVDSDGGLWNAQWGGSCVVRYDADGVETERVDVPTTQPSCVAFGGAKLGTLYITSARVELDADALQRDVHAGGVFIATPAARGIAEPVFRGTARFA
jgi:L-arabinonolactonase